MTEKRYFERKWEGEYYIFDSQTISEKEFDEKVQYEDYQAFADSMTGDDVINRLNELQEENKNLSKLNKILEGFLLDKGYDFKDIIKFLQERTDKKGDKT